MQDDLQLKGSVTAIPLFNFFSIKKKKNFFNGQTLLQFWPTVCTLEQQISKEGKKWSTKYPQTWKIFSKEHSTETDLWLSQSLVKMHLCLNRGKLRKGGKMLTKKTIPQAGRGKIKQEDTHKIST